MRGVLNLDKPSGITSYDAIRRLKRVLRPAHASLVLGHAGTLDPMASGVLLILFGEATKLSRFLMETDKEYEAEVRFGTATDTDDVTGAEVTSAAVPELDHAGLRAVLDRFVGPQDQIPPRYSALKQQGVPMYRRARAAEDFVPEPRRVNVKELELLEWSPPRARVRAVVSSGAYVRALARDVGRAARSAATLSGLRRTRSGRFSVTGALPLDEADADTVRQNLVAIPDALPDMARVSLDEEQARLLLQGQVAHTSAPDADCALASSADGRFLFLAQAASGKLRSRRLIYADH